MVPYTILYKKSFVISGCGNCGIDSLNGSNYFAFFTRVLHTYQPWIIAGFLEYKHIAACMHNTLFNPVFPQYLCCPAGNISFGNAAQVNPHPLFCQLDGIVFLINYYFAVVNERQQLFYLFHGRRAHSSVTFRATVIGRCEMPDISKYPHCYIKCPVGNLGNL